MYSIRLDTKNQRTPTTLKKNKKTTKHWKDNKDNSMRWNNNKNRTVWTIRTQKTKHLKTKTWKPTKTQHFKANNKRKSGKTNQIQSEKTNNHRTTKSWIRLVDFKIPWLFVFHCFSVFALRPWYPKMFGFLQQTAAYPLHLPTVMGSCTLCRGMIPGAWHLLIEMHTKHFRNDNLSCVWMFFNMFFIFPALLQSLPTNLLALTFSSTRRRVVVLIGPAPSMGVPNASTTRPNLGDRAEHDHPDSCTAST